jgi:hypothetical protein
MTAPFLLDEMSEESACLAGRSTYVALQATNNGSERALRLCVIQRKVTNGYRARWAAQAEADARTTVDTARLKGANPFQTILEILV